ncbi:MAG TPA: alpha/beta hydrolase-fold protein, partial [bacterium]|nr:alpha/beta hydrolase-fold protein [bacterium]
MSLNRLVARAAMAIALLLTYASITAAQTAASSYPAHTIWNSQLRVLPPTPLGRHYQLHIGLPGSYSTEKAQRYPVVYVTDAYWDFQKLDAMRGSMVYDRVVPEFIIVGIGYAGENLNFDSMRGWELAPVPFGGGDARTTGHAADFLSTIESEIIPFVEREYRADPSYRVLAGASLGGLFTLYALFTTPELFQAYIAATPAVVVGDNWLLGYEEKFATSGRPLKARLHVSGGGNEAPEFLGGILKFNQRISSRHYPGLAYEFRIVDGERHASMEFEAYVRGLRFAFEPLAPEKGPTPER